MVKKLVQLYQIEVYDKEIQYLLIYSSFVQKVFHLSLVNMNQGDFIHGCKVARNASTISHLFFAVDSFFFFQATMRECNKIKECLSIYEKASGQLVNFQKSSISFSCNVNGHTKEKLCSFLHVSSTKDHGTYLGLPSLVGKNKKAIFSFIKDKA